VTSNSVSDRAAVVTQQRTMWQLMDGTKGRSGEEARSRSSDEPRNHRGEEKRKRSGSEKRRRMPKIDFRVTEAEQAEIKASAQHAGLTVGSYCRSRSLAKPTTRAVRRPAVETAQLAQLLGMLGSAGKSLQSLSPLFSSEEPSSEPMIAELKAAIADFRVAAAAIMRTLGKRPLTLSVEPAAAGISP